MIDTSNDLSLMTLFFPQNTTEIWSGIYSTLAVFRLYPSPLLSQLWKSSGDAGWSGLLLTESMLTFSDLQQLFLVSSVQP